MGMVRTVVACDGRACYRGSGSFGNQRLVLLLGLRSRDDRVDGVFDLGVCRFQFLRERYRFGLWRQVPPEPKVHKDISRAVVQSQAVVNTGISLWCNLVNVMFFSSADDFLDD